LEQAVQVQPPQLQSRHQAGPARLTLLRQLGAVVVEEMESAVLARLVAVVDGITTLAGAGRQASPVEMAGQVRQTDRRTHARAVAVAAVLVAQLGERQELPSEVSAVRERLILSLVFQLATAAAGVAAHGIVEELQEARAGLVVVGSGAGRITILEESARRILEEARADLA
jgi:hypothetical protein